MENTTESLLTENHEIEYNNARVGRNNRNAFDDEQDYPEMMVQQYNETLDLGETLNDRQDYYNYDNDYGFNI